MAALDVLGALQVGEGAGDLEQAVGGAQGQRETLAGGFQPLLVGLAQVAVLAQPWQVEEGIGAALALVLQVPGFGDLLGGGGAAFSGRWRVAQCGGFARHSEVQVDAIEQRPGEFVAIALDLVTAALAASRGFAKVAAGTGIHCGDQLEAGRETNLVPRTGDHYFAALQWLAQDFQDFAVELWQFVQKQYPVMSQGDLAWLRAAAATYQCRA